MSMKALTALAMVIVFLLALLSFGFYTYAILPGDTFCGNGLCDGNENFANCPADCRVGDTSLLSSSSATTPSCGNGVKEGNEQCDAGSANGACSASSSPVCSTGCTINACKGGFEVGKEVVVKLDRSGDDSDSASPDDELYDFQLRDGTGLKDCSIVAEEQDFAGNDRCEAQGSSGSIMKYDSSLRSIAENFKGDCSLSDFDKPIEDMNDGTYVMQRPFGTSIQDGCSGNRCGLNIESGRYGPKGDLYCDSIGTWVLCDSNSKNLIYTDSDGEKWLCNGKDFTHYTGPPITPPPVVSPPPRITTGAELCAGVVCLGANQECRWGNCVTMGVTHNFTEATYTTGLLCKKDTTENKACVTQTFNLPLPNVYRRECLYSINITKFKVVDKGVICAGETCVVGTDTAGIILPPNTIYRGPSFTRSIDVTDFLDSNGPKVTMWASDDSSRSILAAFKILVLNPSPTEKCVMGPDGKPILVPFCTGRDNDCTVTPLDINPRTLKKFADVLCIDVHQFNGFYSVCSKIACNANFVASFLNEQQRSYTCTNGPGNIKYTKTDVEFKKYGNYTSFGFTVTSTRDTPTNQCLCEFGCSAGFCKGSIPPNLTSVTAAPKRVGVKNFTIKMTSVAFDADTITTGTTSRKQQIKLECGTQPGDVQNVIPNSGGQPANTCTPGGGGGCNGFGGPWVWVQRFDSGCSITGTLSVDEMRSNFLSLANAASPVSSAAALESIETELNAMDITLQKNSAGEIRGRLFLPSTVPFACKVDVGSCPGVATGAATTKPTFDVTGLATGNPLCSVSDTQTGSFNADLCSGSLADTNPTCTITKLPGSWASGGNKTIYCRAKDETGLYSDVKNTAIVIDKTPPTSLITSPPAKSVQRTNFAVTVSDSDDSGLDKCFYYTPHTNGTVVLSADSGAGGSAAADIKCNGIDGPCTIPVNTSVIISWTCSGASDAIVLPNGWRGVSGSIPDTLTESRTYTLNCNLWTGAKDSVTVNVKAGSNSTTKSTLNTSSIAGRIKLRPCNGPFKVSVGPGGDCPQQGTCEVSVFANDTFDNIGEPDSREFVIKIISTNITAPEASSFQTTNFSVSVVDKDFVNNANMTCTYDVYSISGNITKTVDGATRNCNSNFTVTIGPDEDCNVMGQNTCRVVAKVTDGISSDTDERFFSIDFITPESRILDAPTNWVTKDFNITVFDDPKGSMITECQYRVVSNGVETVRWTNRTCSSLDSPPSRLSVIPIALGRLSVITITVGPGKNCRHEGGEACTIFVRPLDRARRPGFNDSVTVPILFSGNVTDTNGFSSIIAATTNRGINFSGVTRKELRTATFYVCNSTSSPANCIAAFASGNKGLGTPNLCGSSLSNKCELRCGDQTVSYYLAAKGIPIGTFEIVTVVSPIKTAACPTLNIAGLNRLVALFQQLDEEISIQIMMVDTFIRENGETVTANNDTLQLLNEALLLVRDHLDYMNVTMQDLTTEKSRQIIDRSNEILDKVNALLRGIVSPVIVRLNVDMPPSVRLNRQAVLPAEVSYRGSRPAYGRIFCSVTKPDGTVISDSKACTEFGNGTDKVTDLPISFLPDKLGTWAYSCHITRSVRQDCSFEVEQRPVDGTFSVLPGLNLYIDSISSPDTVIKSQQADVTAKVVNLNEITKFASVTCDFTDPDGFVRRNTSTCTLIPGTADAGGPANFTPVSIKQVVNKVGVWKVGNCALRSSESGNCSASALDNVSKDIKNFSVILPDNLFIESVSLPPSPAINGTPAVITVSLFNPLSTAVYAIAACNIQTPAGALYFEDRAGMEAGTEKTFTLNTVFNVPGIWNVSRCTASKSSSPDFSDPVQTHALNNLGIINVIVGSNLTITSATIPSQVQNGTTAAISISVLNPSTSRFGIMTCNVRNPLNQLTSVSSGCILVPQSSVKQFLIPVSINRKGLWNVDSCSLYGSINSDCSQPVLHDTKLSLGAMESVTTELLSNTQLYVQNISVSNAKINSNVNVLVMVKNLNALNSSYGKVGCRFVDPFSVETLQTSSCGQISPNTTKQFIVSTFVGSAGLWTVRGCFVNSSIVSTCSPSLLQNVSLETRMINVTTPNDLYIAGVDAPDNDIVNNSNVPIDITVTNSFNDDKFGFVACTVTDPNGNDKSKTAPCASVTKQNTIHYNLSFFADIVGAWNVKSCTVSSSSSSSCAGAVVTHEVTNGDIFNVIRGYNLTISPFNVPNFVYIFRPADFTYTLRNPSTSERFGQVTCTFSRSGLNIVNKSSCFQMAPESFVDSKATLVPDTLGAWNVACVAQRSFDASCSSPEQHDSLSVGFNVLQPPDLYIKTLNMPEVVPLNKESTVLLTIKNPVQSTVYGFAGCTFTNRLNETTRNISSCINMSQDENTVGLGITPALRGNWSVSGCFVNVSLSTSCNQSRTHNVSTVSKSFAVTSPFLIVEGNISLVTSNLFVGDVADIVVNVRNIGERDYFSFVNCTLISPTNKVYKLTTPNQTIFLNDVTTFHLQRVVDEAGTWKVGTCSVYRLGSIILEQQQNVNQPFDVQYLPSGEQCNNNIPCDAGFECVNGACVAQNFCSASTCHGTNSGCYCLGDQCVACGPGYTCSRGRCVVETPVNVCTSSRDCGPNLDCISGLCQQKAVECYADADCNEGTHCIEGRCTTPPIQVDKNIIYFLIIIIAVILIPVILFAYIKKSM